MAPVTSQVTRRQGPIAKKGGIGVSHKQRMSHKVKGIGERQWSIKGEAKHADKLSGCVGEMVNK
jgi:hypothetical protein